MNKIEQLPNKEFDASGPIGGKFVELGIGDFHRACRWVRDLPYGYNSTDADPAIIFAEGRGTCATKHGAVAALAREIGLNVDKILGFYRLTDEIIPGTGKILEKYGLTYIPQIHCFLSFRTTFVDLTEGNCHGKKKQLDEFDATFKVKPGLSETEKLEYYKLGLDYYLMNDKELAKFTKDDLIDILKECIENHQILCSIV